VRSSDRFIDHLPLVRDRQTVPRGQLAELFMAGVHDYWIIMIIKPLQAVSTEIFLPSDGAGGAARSMTR
jgi:hypothetical protein